MPCVIVVGGGWAGCAAAIMAAKLGARVVLLERTDQLLGTGLVGGIMRNNGRFTAAEEMIGMGAGELFQTTDIVARHRNINFPGHMHATLYDVTRVEPAVKKLLLDWGVEVQTETRVVSAQSTDRRLEAVITEGGEAICGDAFVEATGSAGPQRNCTKYGNGCCMCVIRCPTFGPRVSLAAKVGINEVTAVREDGLPGAMSGACKIMKSSLDPSLVRELEKKGVVVVPIPKYLHKPVNLGSKACQQYNLGEYAENVVLLDTGPAKLMASFVPLNVLRQIDGFSNARYEDPYSGGRGNSIRFTAISPADRTLRVSGVSNLFCAGEKVGPLVGHTEAIVTGTLAGYNAVRQALGSPLLELPTSLAVGDLIAYVMSQLATEGGLKAKYTFSGSVYFERMKHLGLYTIKIQEITKRIRDSNMLEVFSAGEVS